MRKPIALVIAALAAIAAACLPTTPPRPPAPPPVPQRTIAVQLTPALDGAKVVLTLDGQTMAATTNARGYHAWEPVPDCPAAHTYTIHVEADGYQPIDSPVIGDCRNHEVGITLTPTHANAGEHGALHVDRFSFLRDDGTEYPWVGASEFSLFQRRERGEDIDALLDDILTCGGHCQAGDGPTLVRVLGMFVGDPASDSDLGIGHTNGLGHFAAPSVSSYYTDLRAFADWLASRGTRLEFTVFADAQILMPSEADARAHLDRIIDALQGTWNVTLEIANEPFKNLDGGNDEATRLMQYARGRGLLVASGVYDVPDCATELPHGDYVTVHTDRKSVRTAKDLAEVRDGWDWTNPDGAWKCGGPQAFAGVKVPTVGDEPIGAADLGVQGKRLGPTSSDPDGTLALADAAYYAGTAVLEGAGSTFHSDSGINSTRLTDFQARALAAWAAGARWPPVRAQYWTYQNGRDDGGAGIGDMPLVHFDTENPAHAAIGALRTFCKGDAAHEWCIAIEPGPDWQAQGRDGWTVLEQGRPARGFVRLGR